LNKIVVFGAGNIGRSFIGNIFSSNGMSITFIDANVELVNKLNRKKNYRIIIKRNNKKDEEIQVKNIEAVHSSETDKIIKYIYECDICATSVGQGSLPKIISVIVEGIKIRKRQSLPPLDIIIAENLRNGAAFFRELFREKGLSGNEAGLIETSIGKMVPIMTEADLEKDPLVLNAEEYNTLILDRRGFKNKVPEFPEIKAVENIAAWVDRKLFIHNLGHAASSYLGFLKYPHKDLIADVLEDESLKLQVRNVMTQSAAALLCEYPTDFTEKDLVDHIDDLLFRFQNKALGDTVFRVGRDLSRKLSRDDRILGAAGLCLKHNLPFERIINIFYSALEFKASDQTGETFRGDETFLGGVEKMGISKTLTDLCGLDPVKDGKLIKTIVEADND